jgi:light-regulated signal transduction histidine kinase (bacteriophytochrome)
MLARQAYSLSDDDDRVQEELRDFSYIVSHDLASEFRYVAEFSKLLLKDLPGDSEARSSADFVCSAALRCQAMLDQVRVYSRAQRRPSFKAVSLGRLIETVVLQASEAIGRSGAKVEIYVSGEICGDEELLREAFGRLLCNALGFARQNIAPKVEIYSETDADGLTRVRVIDNGVGLQSVYWEKAFRMFWRLDPKRRPEAVGAGLAICRRIVRQHDGEVGFIECDGGACVEVTLPDRVARAPEGMKERHHE